MRVYYEEDVDFLALVTDRPQAGGQPMEVGDDVIVKVGSEDGTDIVALELIGASGYMAPFFVPRKGGSPAVGREYRTARRYDEDTDTIFVGVDVGDPSLTTTSVDDALVAYWQPSDLEDGFHEFIGFAILNVSEHLSPFFKRAGHAIR